MEARPLSELLGGLDSLLAEQKKIDSQWKAVGSTLRSARVSANVSQSDIEEISGVPQAYLSQIENGHKTPSTSTVEAVTTALHTLSTTGGSHGHIDQGQGVKQGGAKEDARKARKGKGRKRGQ